MVAVVANDIILTTREAGNHTAVDRKASGETKRFVLANKFGQFALQLCVKVKRSVEKARTGATAAVFAQGLYTCFYHTLIARQTSISIRTEHKDVMAAHFNFGTLFAFNLSEVRINTLGHIFLW